MRISVAGVWHVMPSINSGDLTSSSTPTTLFFGDTTFLDALVDFLSRDFLICPILVQSIRSRTADVIDENIHFQIIQAVCIWPWPLMDRLFVFHKLFPPKESGNLPWNSTRQMPIGAWWLRLSMFSLYNPVICQRLVVARTSSVSSVMLPHVEWIWI